MPWLPKCLFISFSIFLVFKIVLAFLDSFANITYGYSKKTWKFKKNFVHFHSFHTLSDLNWFVLYRNIAIFLNTSLRGRFAPIFYINCEHVLFVYIVKQNKNYSRIFTKDFVDFQNVQKFNEDRILMETNIWNFDHS